MAATGREPVTISQLKTVVGKINPIENGGTVNGDLNVIGTVTANKVVISGVITEDTDAVNKKYVDEVIGAINAKLDSISGEVI